MDDSGCGCGFLLLILIVVLFFVLPGRNNDIVLHMDDVGQYCDTSLFRGIVPGMSFEELNAVAGTPDRFDYSTDEDYSFCDPVYYYDSYSLSCSWSGDKSDSIGRICYSPYSNDKVESVMTIDSLLYIPIDSCSISTKTHHVYIIQGDQVYYEIRLDKLKIKEIEYSLFPTRFMSKRTLRQKKSNYWFYNGNWEPYKSKQ